jgi:hypothetical protein
VGATGLAAVGTALFLAGHDPGTGYAALVRALSLTLDGLAPAIWLAGLVLGVAAALLAWALALLASFRVGGPLYRLSRNLERQLDDPQAPFVPVRQDDHLQVEAGAVAAAVTGLRTHQTLTAGLVTVANVRLAHRDRQGASDALARAREELGRVQL